MPSLQDLQEFKASFKEIGRESSVLTETGEQYDDLPLPDIEPVPLDLQAEALSGVESGEEYPLGDEQVDTLSMLENEAAAPASGEEDFDFSGFIDSLTENAFAEPEEAAGESESIGAEEANINQNQADFQSNSPEGEEFSVPEDLLQGFSDEIEESRTEAGPDASSEDFTETGAGTEVGYEAGTEVDFGNEAEGEPEDFSIPDLGLEGVFSPEASSETPNETPSQEAAETPEYAESETADVFGTDFSLPQDEHIEGHLDETGAIEQTNTAIGPENDILDLENLGGEELGFEEIPPPSKPQESAETETAVPEEPEAFDFSIPEFEGPIPEGSPSSGAEAAASSGLGDLGSLGEPSLSEFDEFSLGTETIEGFGSETAAEKTETGFTGMPAMEDFSLAGIDDLFKQPEEAPRGPAPKGRTAKAAEPKGVTVEEISLTEEDYKKLEATLASYPLNLRIACEELIAEQAVVPDQMAALIKMLVNGASAKETAALAGRLLGRSIQIPKGFEKKTGEELEAEQASFAYIFRHRVLPILGLFVFVLLVSASLFYLTFEFIYTPLKAESIYKKGYERIEAGDYQRANERFSEAFGLWRNKSWFFKYAQKFRDKRQYIYAEQKYEELLRYYPRDKKGALEFADFEATYLNNYSKADRILRDHILEYSLEDKDGLLALGDINLAWGDSDPKQYGDRYEEARKAYARYMGRYGREDPVMERMLRYFIRVDNLAEVLSMQSYFMESEKRKISGMSLAEMGGYLLDKKLQVVTGVPDKHIAQIEGLREVLQRAIKRDKNLPEGYYHLARYFSKFGKPSDEKAMLEMALNAFEKAPELSGRRIGYHIDTYRRYASLLRDNREFISAQAQLIAGIGVYEDAVQRKVLARNPEFGRLYADLADIEYFSAGNYDEALKHYALALAHGWAQPETQYRMGVIYYTKKSWPEALEKFFETSVEFPLNRRLLFALGNTSYLRGNYFAAHGYYNRLLDMLETERSRFPMLVPNDRPEHMELVERLMMARNNLAATLENLADATGNASLRSQALALYAESSRAWDLITRDPKSMIRSDSKNLAYLNTRNALYPVKNYERQIYIYLDKDVLEPSPWEKLLQK
ncbi:MAG: tetratricopeptide repeat protein [Treponema sp.]|nr:tetratricopeptide repeat protein [Treponema sp.]